MWTNSLDFFFLEKEIDPVRRDFERARRLADRRRDSRQRARVASPRGCGAASRTCSRPPSAVATTTSTATRACRRTPPSGSSSTCSSPRCTTSAQPQCRAAARFYAALTEPFDRRGPQGDPRSGSLDLFDDVKKRVRRLVFNAGDEITLSDRALAFIVGELAPYDLAGTDIDAKGLAYQELVGTNLRGDRGQYFTPRGAVKLMVEILDPKEDETVLDPACGTGGFLRATLTPPAPQVAGRGRDRRAAGHRGAAGPVSGPARASTPTSTSSAPTSTRSWYGPRR